MASLNAHGGNSLNSQILPSIRVPPSTGRGRAGFSFFQNSPSIGNDGHNIINNSNNSCSPSQQLLPEFISGQQQEDVGIIPNTINSSSRRSEIAPREKNNSNNKSNSNTNRPRKCLNLSLNIQDINQDVENGLPMSPAGEQSRRDQRAIQVQCSSILDDFLFVGGVTVASNLDTLLQNNITHIINCVGQKCENLWPNHFKYLKYEIPDNGTDDIIPYLREAFEFIENAKNANGKVLIHCIKGISRSPAIAIGYLMWKRRLSVENALVIVRGHRQIADPNPSFVFQLKDWQERLRWQL